MSTRYTRKQGRGYHLHSDCVDDDRVIHLVLTREPGGPPLDFTAEPDCVRVGIPIDTWNAIVEQGKIATEER